MINRLLATPGVVLICAILGFAFGLWDFLAAPSFYTLGKLIVEVGLGGIIGALMARFVLRNSD